MNLAEAASYFADTPIAGWNGSGWDEEVTTVTLLPYDRSASNIEAGNKRRFLLAKVEDETFEGYSVIRLPNEQVYLVGFTNVDMVTDEYSQVVSIHRALYQIELISFTKTLAASGMAKSVARTSLGTYWGDLERTSGTNSKEFEQIAFSQTLVTLPRDCPVDTDNELSANGKFYAISEAYDTSGFKICRAMAKRSS